MSALYKCAHVVTLSFGMMIGLPASAKDQTAKDRTANDRIVVPQSHRDSPSLFGPYTLSLNDDLRALMMRSQLAELGLVDKHASSAAVAPLLQNLPTVLPSAGYISSGFGIRRSPFSGRRKHHNGLDIAVAYGSAVRATAAGVVTEAGWRRNLGYTVTIDHASGIKTRYGHNAKLRVRVGDEVQRGDLIALAGSTGHSTGSHVHYEVWVRDQRIDPTTMLLSPSGDYPAIAPTAWASYESTTPPLPTALGLGGDEDDGLGRVCTRQHPPAPKRRTK